MLDVIIRGGRVATDGTRLRTADVGIEDGHHPRRQNDGERARITIDAKGLVVAPGFATFTRTPTSRSSSSEGRERVRRG